MNGGESTSEYVCVGAQIHVNVGGREGIWLSVLESTCESVCLGAHIHVNVCVREWNVVECVRIYM